MHANEGRSGTAGAALLLALGLVAPATAGAQPSGADARTAVEARATAYGRAISPERALLGRTSGVAFPTGRSLPSASVTGAGVRSPDLASRDGAYALLGRRPVASPVAGRGGTHGSIRIDGRRALLGEVPESALRPADPPEPAKRPPAGAGGRRRA